MYWRLAEQPWQMNSKRSEKYWQDYDFFYLHYKKTDTCGENGDFEGKVKAIEEFDALSTPLDGTAAGCGYCGR